MCLATHEELNRISNYTVDHDCSALDQSEHHKVGASLLQVGALRHGRVSAKQTPESTVAELPRPGLKNEEADVIEFGMLVKSFYGIEFSHNTFSVDLVISLRWTDTRAAKVLPSDATEMYLPIAVARRKMWLPDVTVTNRALQGIETITSSVKVREDGSVTQVDRIMANVKCGFNATSFPFDSQRLRIRIASSTYMSDAVVLRPSADPRLYGVVGNTVGNSFVFVSTEQLTFIEVNGDLSRSRGELDIVVERKTSVFMETIMLPTIAIVVSSWAGFFIPIAPAPFLMPRVAVSFVAFLSLVTESRKIDAMLPQRGEQAWSDVFTECCILLVFAAEIFTMLVQYVHYSLGLAELAHSIDLEMRVFLPTMTLLTSGTLYLLRDESSVYAMSWIVRIMLGLIIGGYLITCIARCLRKKSSGEPPST